jgi:hypothetical protein
VVLGVKPNHLLGPGERSYSSAASSGDGPHHGERVPAPTPAEQYQARIAEAGIEVALDRITDDWKAARDYGQPATGSTSTDSAVSACPWGRDSASRWRPA